MIITRPIEVNNAEDYFTAEYLSREEAEFEYGIKLTVVAELSNGTKYYVVAGPKQTVYEFLCDWLDENSYAIQYYIDSAETAVYRKNL